jgi:hypothetical protein
LRSGNNLPVVRVFHGDRQLDDDEPLQSLLVAAEEELQLTVMRGGAGAGAAEVLQRLHKAGLERASEGKPGITVHDKDSCYNFHEAFL